jgi:GNAT superfamily N-acetyltransferase
MSGAITVRGYRPGDLAAVAEILRSATRQAYTFMAWTHNDDSFADFIADTLETWDAVRVAEAGTAPVGFACLEGDLLDQLFVLPAWQGRGVGGLLLDDIKKLRPEGFRLYTFQKNLVARAFYEKRGLVETGRGFSEQEQEADIAYRWEPQ